MARHARWKRSLSECRLNSRCRRGFRYSLCPRGSYGCKTRCDPGELRNFAFRANNRCLAGQTACCDRCSDYCCGGSFMHSASRQLCVPCHPEAVYTRIVPVYVMAYAQRTGIA
jgi:hypothetical protein